MLHDARPAAPRVAVSRNPEALDADKKARELGALSDPVWATRYAGEFEFRPRTGGHS